MRQVFYYKMRQLFKNETILLQNVTVITKYTGRDKVWKQRLKVRVKLKRTNMDPIYEKVVRSFTYCNLRRYILYQGKFSSAKLSPLVPDENVYLILRSL